MPNLYCVFGGGPSKVATESRQRGPKTRLTTGTIFTDKLFTGQREMAGLGIYHYNARFYSPKLGRFLSADTIVPGYANPQAYNRYSYVLNNPLKYTDPSGHSQCRTQEDCDDMGTTPMGTGNPHNGGGSNNNGNNGNPHDDDNDIDPNPNSLPASTPEFVYTDHSTAEDYDLVGYDERINWSQVDWYHLITNGAGIAGDLTGGLAIIGILPAAPVAGFTQFIDLIGVTTDVIDFVSEGDFSGISLDVAKYVFKETKAVRVVPVIGFTSNVRGFSEALYRGSTMMPIWQRKLETDIQP